jgi:hypothetical protein
VKELGEECLMAEGGFATLLVHGGIEGLTDLVTALADLDERHCHISPIIILYSENLLIFKIKCKSLTK